ncbi:MAG: hypothetical protein LBO00_02975 [Zoogloeaceae bacterium]|nr:hypothetical protein [Zoogloeaceae bacterium]
MSPGRTFCVTLQPHPASRPALRGQGACVVKVQGRRQGAWLVLTYCITGDLAALSWPEKPLDAERLWAHTCCELFVRREPETAYLEYNFSPMDAMNMWYASHPQLFLHPPESNRPGCDSYPLPERCTPAAYPVPATHDRLERLPPSICFPVFFPRHARFSFFPRRPLATSGELGRLAGLHPQHH